MLTVPLCCCQATAVLLVLLFDLAGARVSRTHGTHGWVGVGVGVGVEA